MVTKSVKYAAVRNTRLNMLNPAIQAHEQEPSSTPLHNNSNMTPESRAHFDSGILMAIWMLSHLFSDHDRRWAIEPFPLYK
jgi:hypothetical protein